MPRTASHMTTLNKRAILFCFVFWGLGIPEAEELTKEEEGQKWRRGGQRQGRDREDSHHFAWVLPSPKHSLMPSASSITGSRM